MWEFSPATEPHLTNMTPTLLKYILEIKMIFTLNMETQKTKRNNCSPK